MKEYGLYLVCKDHINEVKDFLGKFFPEEKGKYSHETWVTFKPEGTDFQINLMEGKELPLTQNVFLEVYCDSLEQLNEIAKEHQCEVQNFLATAAEQRYRYHFIEIAGPKTICYIEVSYAENLEE